MPTNPMSIIVTYIKAYIIENSYIELQQINNIIEPLERFDEKVKKLEKQKWEKEGIQEYTILLTITTQQSRGDIEKYMSEDIKNIYNKFKKYKSEEYELEGGCYLNYHCQVEDEEIIDNIIDLWLEKEKPKVYGKQILTKPYRLKDLCGRMIIGVYPSYTYGNWNLLLEGGVKLSLADGESYFNKAITSEDFAKWTQGEINNILKNPCYSYGIFPEPIDLFYEWQRAFIYQLAMLPNIKDDILEKVYHEFLEFIKEHVCKCIQCPTIIPKKQSLSVLKIHIKAMKNYIKVKDQSIIAKNDLLNIGKRYAYMPAIKEIIKKYFNKDEQYKNKKYKNSKMIKLIQQLEQNTNYDKGIAMEKLAKYFLETIPRNTSDRKQN